MAAKAAKIVEAIEELRGEADLVTGAISGAQARQMYLQAEWIATNLKEVLFRSNGWREGSD